MERQLPLYIKQEEQFSAGGFNFVFNEQDYFNLSPQSSYQDIQMLCDWKDHVGLQDTDIDPMEFLHQPDFQIPEVLPTPEKEKILFPGDVEPLRVSSSIQTDSVLKKIIQARSVLINGEREILGKNIIGLHSLNELCASPGDNCQITSTVINGKRYKIIIRAKSNQNAKEVAHNTNDKPSSNVKQTATEDDAFISELQNGDYGVLGNDEEMLHPWHLNCDNDESGLEKACDNANETPRVPPLRIKLPKKLKKKPKNKNTDEEKNVSVKLDHDYCTASINNNLIAEKHPRKDSGLESGGASDASVDSPTVEFPSVKKAPPPVPIVTSKLIEERRRTKNHADVTKMAAQLFRAANMACLNQNEVQEGKEEVLKDEEDGSKGESLETEKPKRKLKLEEYLSRRPIKPEVKKEVNEKFESTRQTLIKVAENVAETQENEKEKVVNSEENTHCPKIDKREETHYDRKRKRRISSSSPDVKRKTKRSRDRSRRSYDRSSSNSSCCSDDSPVRRRYSSSRRFERSRSRSFYRDRSLRKFYGMNHWSRVNQMPIEERRIIYVGRIEDGLTSQQLRQRFSIFGPIEDVSVHFRERGENYGFVTFVYKEDAYCAVEHGNDDPTLPVYELSFGGRRTFCRQRYADLDEMPTTYSALVESMPKRPAEDTFDLLLKKAKENIRRNVKS